MLPEVQNRVQDPYGCQGFQRGRSDVCALVFSDKKGQRCLNPMTPAVLVA